MFIKSREVVQLLALLIITCQLKQTTGIPFYEPLTALENASQAAQQNTIGISTKQQQLVSQEPGNQENLKRYQLEDLDFEGYTLKTPTERWRVVNLNQLLDVLNSPIPTVTPNPIYRSGRDNPLASLSDGLDLQLAGIPSLKSVSQAQQKRPINKSELPQNVVPRVRKLPLLGVFWPPSSAAGANYVNIRGSQVNSATTPHHSIGTQEIPLQTPMHSRSSDDYEWKRVENSRWNNLRGMWGKRSVGPSVNSDQDKLKSAYQQQLVDLRPM